MTNIKFFLKNYKKDLLKYFYINLLIDFIQSLRFESLNQWSVGNWSSKLEIFYK